MRHDAGGPSLDKVPMDSRRWEQINSTYTKVDNYLVPEDDLPRDSVYACLHMTAYS